MKWFKRKPQKLNETTRLYALYGESRNLKYLEDKVDNVKQYVDNQDNDLRRKINANTASISNNVNSIYKLQNRLDNLPKPDLTEIHNKINTNTSNIATNKSNITSLNNKVSSLTNNLANANIASYRGPWNSNTRYKVGDIVSINNHFYLATAVNSNSQPPTTGNDKWKLLTFTVDTSGFLTDSDLTPLRNNITANQNNITTNKNNISTNTNNISLNKNNINSLENRIHNLENPRPQVSKTISRNQVSVSMIKSGLWSGREYLYNVEIDLGYIFTRENAKSGDSFLITLLVSRIGSGNGQTYQDRNLTFSVILDYSNRYYFSKICFDYYSAVDFYYGGSGKFTGTIWYEGVYKKL